MHCMLQIGHVTFFWNGNRSGYLDPKLEQFKEVGGPIDGFPCAFVREHAFFAKACMPGNCSSSRSCFCRGWALLGHMQELSPFLLKLARRGGDSKENRKE